MSLAPSVLAGDTLALARLLTQVENETPEGMQALDELFAHTGKAHMIGITGGTGTGKSSLVNRLALHYRKPPEEEPRRVAIIAVDPSSPFTGGAVLGDRVRMGDLTGDQGVFIRSMAARGSLGGLARMTAAMAQVLDAAGFGMVLIETVGAGQSEVEIARLAHTTLVVEAPGLGDDIQAIKAGILEIADILVVNKGDLAGAEKTEKALRNMLGLAHPVRKNFPSRSQPGEARQTQLEWMPPIMRTTALDGKGIAELAQAIDKHGAFLRENGGWERRERARLESELDSLLTKKLMGDFFGKVGEEQYCQAVEALLERRQSPGETVKSLLGGIRI
jgi:LAO/AO transport system kinase